MSKENISIYVIAVGGTGTAPLACLLQEKGHRVRGSDGSLYPPMSTLLDEFGIRPHVGWDPSHLHDPRPDLVVVGNAVPRDNPEARETERLGLPRVSMPEALYRFFLSERSPLVVAGTHGKTTTTSLAAWVWTEAEGDPGYLIGGLPHDLPASFRIGTGRRFLVEGDEYNAAYFDRGPKFLHYRPQTLILTSVEYDHADLYETPEDLFAAYRELVRRLPEDGLLVAWGDSDGVREAAAEAPCRVIFYGTGEGNDVRPVDGRVDAGPDGSRFRLIDPETGEMEIALRISGEHNLWNALGVWAAARADGLPADRVAAALGSFRGVARRLQELGTAAGVTVIDDFAHHPTAVGKSLEALRQRYPDRRLTALFEPRSLTAGRVMFHAAYLEAFRAADRVGFAPVFHEGRLSDDERIDLDALSQELGDRGTEARPFAGYEDLLAWAVDSAREGDVVVTMSSGSFEGMPRRVLDGLRERG